MHGDMKNMFVVRKPDEEYPDERSAGEVKGLACRFQSQMYEFGLALILR